MINVYIDPHSYIYLDNKLFEKGGRDDLLSGWRYLKDYCHKHDINLNTIDLWNKTTNEDFYVSFEHKSLIRKLYWKFKNKKYPIIKLNKFKKRILFQFEPPINMPEVYINADNLFKIYDKVFFSCKLNNPKIHYFHYYQAYDNIFIDYWNNSKRAFLTIISSNKKLWDLQKFLAMFFSTGRIRYKGCKKLLAERIRAIKFFSETNDIEIYGSGWNKRPSFPYWFYKKAIQKVYKGKAESKHQTLSKYNFSICFENCIFTGYITEKIFDCFFTGNIPIYFGAPDIQKYIPKNCFIDARNFKNYSDLKLYLKSLTESEIQVYRENAHKFLGSEQYKPFTKEYFAKTFITALK